MTYPRHIRDRANRHAICLLTFLFIAAPSLYILTGCKSQKETQASAAADTYAVSASTLSGMTATLDSLYCNRSFNFDTLSIEIERRTDAALPPETMRIKAVNGRIADCRTSYRDSLAAYNSLDTVAFMQSTSESSKEHTATTRIYNPPDATALCIVAAIGILLYYFTRRNN